jgi:hypothetical protein
MKRLLIASFLIISSVSILALTQQPSKKTDCKQNICCIKKNSKPQETGPKVDYIFWEPMQRLMMVTY